jgi:hypothetical protein
MKPNLLVFLILVIAGAGVAYHFHPEYFQALTTAVSITNKSTTSSGTGTTSVSSPPTVTTTPEIALFVPPDPLPQKDDWTWTTTDGKTYNKVKIVKVEADCVTILDSEGGARIDIGTLPADIQSQLKYNPALAHQAAQNRQNEIAASHDAEVATTQPAAPRTDAAPADSTTASASNGPTVDPQSPLADKLTPKQSKMDADTRLMLQQELVNLNDDIVLKQKIILQNGYDENHGLITSQNGLREAIDHDQKQIAAIREQLEPH